MKRKISIALAVSFGIASAASSIALHEMKSKSPSSSTTVVQAYAADADLSKEGSIDQTPRNLGSEKDETLALEGRAFLPKKADEKDTNVVTVAQSSKGTQVLSRGGTPPKTSAKKVEMLDWWKSARYVFPIGSVVTVKDVQTGKTFKIKRTMGENHADCEALTLEDTQIIKSIWGGFSWDVRPVHIYINGRILAASMAGQPHAGVDSAPAFAVVDNRSEGYGTGENLDTIKGNGMDGHFDVHFLNSTRHKDGQIDSRHQAAVKAAAAAQP